MPGLEFCVFEKTNESARRVGGPSSRRANAIPPAYTSLGTLKLPDGSTTEVLIAHLSKIFGEDIEPTSIVGNLNADVTFLRPSSFLFLRDGYTSQACSQPCVEYIDLRASLAEGRPIRLMLQRVLPNPAPPRRPSSAPPPRLHACIGEPLEQGPASKQPQPPPPPPAGRASPVVPPSYCLPPSCSQLLSSLASCSCSCFALQSAAGGRMAVKSMGSKTVPMNKDRSAEEAAAVWNAVMYQKQAIFEEYYARLQAVFPGQSFDFFTDGDPPDKEDDWKMFTAFVSMKPANTLTITRKDESKKEERIQNWKNKGVKNVDVAVAPNGPRQYTLYATQAVVVMNIVAEAPVFDMTQEKPMLDGRNFEDFQIQNGEWTVPSKNSRRPILRPMGLPDTEVMSREQMQAMLMSTGVQEVVVKSQGQIELERDLGGYMVVPVDGEFSIYVKQAGAW